MSENDVSRAAPLNPMIASESAPAMPAAGRHRARLARRAEIAGRA
jgi:hypothetical protein